MRRLVVVHGEEFKRYYEEEMRRLGYGIEVPGQLSADLTNALD